MESNHVRDLMEAYSSIYAENEEVEQLDEFAPGLQGPVNKVLKGGQEFLKGLGLKVNEKERPTPDQNAQKAKINQNQSFDLFDIIKGHLLDEGFADTEEAALAIMTNMSEEWREQILDEGFKRMNRRKIEKQAQRLGGDRATTLRSLSNNLDTEDWRKHSTSQARKNRAGGAGSEYRKGKELQARDDAQADIKKYGLS